MNNETIEIAVEVIHDTDAALLIFDGMNEAWIPRSLIEDYDTNARGEISEITIPVWFAKQKELV